LFFGDFPCHFYTVTHLGKKGGKNPENKTTVVEQFFFFLFYSTRCPTPVCCRCPVFPGQIFVTQPRSFWFLFNPPFCTQPFFSPFGGFLQRLYSPNLPGFPTAGPCFPFFGFPKTPPNNPFVLLPPLRLLAHPTLSFIFLEPAAQPGSQKENYPRPGGPPHVFFFPKWGTFVLPLVGPPGCGPAPNVFGGVFHFLVCPIFWGGPLSFFPPPPKKLKVRFFFLMGGPFFYCGCPGTPVLFTLPSSPLFACCLPPCVGLGQTWFFQLGSLFCLDKPTQNWILVVLPWGKSKFLYKSKSTLGGWFFGPRGFFLPCVLMGVAVEQIFFLLPPAPLGGRWLFVSRGGFAGLVFF